MKNLKILNINNYKYELEDEEHNIYKLNIEFYDLEKEIKVNDYICMAEELLNKNYTEYSNFYRFGKLNSPYGRKITEIQNSIDIIGLKQSNNLIHLQRYYG